MEGLKRAVEERRVDGDVKTCRTLGVIDPKLP
jgi:hypothetical protein